MDVEALRPAFSFQSLLSLTGVCVVGSLPCETLELNDREVSFQSLANLTGCGEFALGLKIFSVESFSLQSLLSLTGEDGLRMGQSVSCQFFGSFIGAVPLCKGFE